MPRKPLGMSFESFIDRQIREAADKGAFDNLPGTGEPLKGLQDSGPDQWVQKKLAEEQLSMPLPPGLQLRKDVRESLQDIRRMEVEAEVRAALTGLNAKISKANSRHVAGPPSNLAPVDIDRFVDRWRAERST